MSGRVVHVICCNDSLEAAVLGDEKQAEARMESLKAAYLELNKWTFRDREDYNRRCYWHIHTLNLEEPQA